MPCTRRSQVHRIHRLRSRRKYTPLRRFRGHPAHFRCSHKRLQVVLNNHMQARPPGRCKCHTHRAHLHMHPQCRRFRRHLHPPRKPRRTRRVHRTRCPHNRKRQLEFPHSRTHSLHQDRCKRHMHRVHRRTHPRCRRFRPHLHQQHRAHRTRRVRQVRCPHNHTLLRATPNIHMLVSPPDRCIPRRHPMLRRRHPRCRRFHRRPHRLHSPPRRCRGHRARCPHSHKILKECPSSRT